MFCNNFSHLLFRLTYIKSKSCSWSFQLSHFIEKVEQVVILTVFRSLKTTILLLSAHSQLSSVHGNLSDLFLHSQSSGVHGNLSVLVPHSQLSSVHGYLSVVSSISPLSVVQCSWLLVSSIFTTLSCQLNIVTCQLCNQVIWKLLSSGSAQSTFALTVATLAKANLPISFSYLSSKEV